MTRKIGLFAFCFGLILAIFTLQAERLKAYSNSEIVPQPDVMCDPDLGCLLYTVLQKTVDYDTILYNRKDTSKDWTKEFMFGCPNQALITIGAEGCGVASQATIASVFMNDSIDPGEINTIVTTSCSYSGNEFRNAYPTIGFIYSLDHLSLSGKSKQYIMNLLAPKVASGKLIIMRSTKKVIDVETGKISYPGHFEVVDGFKGDVTYWQYGITVNNVTELFMNDSSKLDFTLTSFLANYPIPAYADVFTDLD